MMDFDGEEMQAEFERVFDHPISHLTVPQLNWLVKVMKHVRGRCRSNAALKNYLNRNFTGHTFTEVPVEDKEYTTLQITPKIVR